MSEIHTIRRLASVRPARLLSILATLVAVAPVLTAGTLMLGPGAAPAQATTTATCGSVLFKSSDWLGGNGVNVYSNGAYTGTGTSCGLGDTRYGPQWQCVELVERFLDQVEGLAPLYGNNGGWVAGHYAETYHLPLIANGTPGKAPQPGDVISFSATPVFSANVPGSRYVGHVAVVAASTVNSSGNGQIVIASQNTPSSRMTLTVSSWHVSGVFGYANVEWVRPAGAVAPQFIHPGDDVAMTSSTSGYVLRGDGQVRTLAGTVVQPAMWPHWEIARGIVVRSNASSGYVLDGWGGIHPFGGAPAVTGAAYWSGRDIARGIALVSDSSGYVLDAFGGIHPFGGAPAVSGGPSWPGWDIARSIVVLPNHTGGYVLDGWGGIHPFAIGANPIPPVTNGGTYWSGWDIARDLVLNHTGTGGYVLDGWGGIHRFGVGIYPPPAGATGYAYWSGRDIARGIALSPQDSGGEVVDGNGNLHPFSVPAPVCPTCQ